MAKLNEAIERLTGTVGMLRNEVEKLTNIMGRVVFPAEAMDELIGELRAFRYLLDQRGDYSFLDRVKAKRDMNRARAATSKNGGKGGK